MRTSYLNYWLIYKPVQLLGLISDLAPEQANDRRKLKRLFDIGAIEVLNNKGLDCIDETIDMAKKQLGYDEAETRKLIQYLQVFY